jgi:uncharacterized protein YkwD
MTVSRVAVASRLPRPLIKIGLRFALILITSLTATTGLAFAQKNSSRPVARLIASGAIPPDTARPRVVISSNASRLSAAPAAPAPVAVSSNVASLERRAFDLVNAQRRSRGQQPLAWDAELARLARSHSENMASSDVFNHTEQGGVTMVDRARAQGIRGWSALGENIAYNQGYDDPAAFVAERWMVSSKHRENLLNSRWTRSAIGVAITSDGRVFFTQVFIAP